MSNQPGLTLADLASQTEDVPVGDSFIRVNGVSAKQVLAIFQRFPEIAKLTKGFNAATLADVAPDALAAAIAAGTGHFGDEDAERDASNVSIEIQYDLLEAIGRLTFKNGFGPFVQRVLNLANVASSAVSTKVPSMNLPQASKPSSPPDTPQT